MYRFLVIAIVVAVAGLELTFPTTETSTRVRAMLPDVQLASVLTPQTANARETEIKHEPTDLWDLQRVNNEPPTERSRRTRFHSGF